jgi:hypothetical protein
MDAKAIREWILTQIKGNIVKVTSQNFGAFVSASPDKVKFLFAYDTKPEMRDVYRRIAFVSKVSEA